MARSLARDNTNKEMAISTAECCNEIGQQMTEDVCNLSCQDRFVAKHMENFPPSSIVRRKSSLSVCCKCSRTSAQTQRRWTPIGQRMFEQLLSHERKKERLLVPDLATEWFRKQKIFLDQVTREEQQAVKEQTAKEPSLMSYVCECRQRCGCGNESTLQHSVQYLDYCQELRRRRLLLQRQRRQNEPTCKCSDPIKPIKRTENQQKEQQQHQKDHFMGGMMHLKPATGTLYPHRTCSCLRSRNFCACTFQADGQPMSDECRLALLCRTESSLMHLSKKCSFREMPQRQLDPACYRRISPEFYCLLKRYEDGMSKRYPLYGLSKRYWGKSTAPCCSCEERMEDPCMDECLGDQSLVTERELQHKEKLERVPKKKLKQAKCKPESVDELEEYVCDCKSIDTVIDVSQKDDCFLNVDIKSSAREEYEENRCECRQSDREHEQTCSSEQCVQSQSLTECYTAEEKSSKEQENIETEVTDTFIDCTDTTCPNRREVEANESRSSRLHFCSQPDPDRKATCLGKSVSQQGYNRSKKQYRKTEDQQHTRKGILNSMAGLCKRVLHPGRHLLYNLSTVQRQPPSYDKKPHKEEELSVWKPRWILPSGANTTSIFSHKPKRGNSQQRKPEKQLTISQATASSFTVQSSRQSSRHNFSKYAGNKINWQSEHVMEKPFVFSGCTDRDPRSLDSNQFKHQQVPQVEKVSTVSGSQLNACIVAKDSCIGTPRSLDSNQFEQEQVSQREEDRSVSDGQLTAYIVAKDSCIGTSSAVQCQSKISSTDSQLTAESQLTESPITSIDTLQPETVSIDVFKEEECQKAPASRGCTARPSYTPASDYAELMRLVARKRTKPKQRKRRVVSFADRDRSNDKKSTNPMHIARERYKTMPAKNSIISAPTRIRHKIIKVTQFDTPEFKESQGPSYSRAPMYNLLESSSIWKKQDSDESFTNFNQGYQDLRDRRESSCESFDNRSNQRNWHRNMICSYERSDDYSDQGNANNQNSSGYVRDYSNQQYNGSSKFSDRNLMKTQNEQTELTDSTSRSTMQYGSQASSNVISDHFRNVPTKYATSLASNEGYGSQAPGLSGSTALKENLAPPGQQNVERDRHYHVSEPEFRDVPIMRRSHSLDTFESNRRSALPLQTHKSYDTTNGTVEQLSNTRLVSYSSSVPRWRSKSQNSEASGSMLPKIFTSKPPLNEKLLKLREAAAKVPKVKIKAAHVKAQCSLRTRRPPPRRVLQEKMQQQWQLQQAMQAYMDYRQERVLKHQHYDQPLQIHADQPSNAKKYDIDKNNDNGNLLTAVNFGTDRWRSLSGCDLQFRDEEQPSVFLEKSKLLSENSSSIGIQCNRKSFIHTAAPSSIKKKRKKAKVYGTSDRNLESEESCAKTRQSQHSQTDLCWQKSDDSFKQTTDILSHRFRQLQADETYSRQEFPTEERYERRRPQVIKQQMGRAFVSTCKLLQLPDYGEAGRGIVAKRSKDLGNSDEDNPVFSESFAYPQNSRRRSSSLSDKYAIELPSTPAVKAKQQQQRPVPKPSSILKAIAKPINNVLNESSDFRRVNFVSHQQSNTSLDACIDPNKFSCSRYEGYSTGGTPSCFTVQSGTRRPAVLRPHTVLTSKSQYFNRDEQQLPQTDMNRRKKKLPSLFAVPTSSAYTMTFNKVLHADEGANSERLSVRAKTQEEQEIEESQLPMNCQLFSKRSDFPNTRIQTSSNDRYMPPSVSLVSDLDFNTHCELSRYITSEEMRKAGGGMMETIDVPLMLTTVLARRHQKQTSNTTPTTGSPTTSLTSHMPRLLMSTGTARKIDKSFSCYADSSGEKDNYCQRRHCCLRRLPEEPVVIEPTHTGLREQQARQNFLPILFYGRKC